MGGLLGPGARGGPGLLLDQGARGAAQHRRTRCDGRQGRNDGDAYARRSCRRVRARARPLPYNTCGDAIRGACGGRTGPTCTVVYKAGEMGIEGLKAAMVEAKIRYEGLLFRLC